MTLPPARHWLRFSLATMLLVTAVVCVVVRLKVREVKRQRAVVQWVTNNRGLVLYDYEYEGTASPPKWCIDLLGVDYFAEVVAVSLPDTVTDVTPLEQISTITSMFIHPADDPVEVTKDVDGRQNFTYFVP